MGIKNKMEPLIIPNARQYFDDYVREDFVMLFKYFSNVETKIYTTPLGNYLFEQMSLLRMERLRGFMDIFEDEFSPRNIFVITGPASIFVTFRTYRED